MNLSDKVMQADVPKLCLLVATLALGSVWGGGACERGKTWWDRQRGTCVPCTVCDKARLAVLLPCELHRDAVCQSLYDIRIYPFNTPERNESDSYEYSDYEDVSESEPSEETGAWDVQTSTLTLAASGCVVFFVVVLFLSLSHAKQWRALKQTLKSDVQDLSAKLKLMEAGEISAEPVVPSDHHIYCNIHVGKDVLLGSTPTRKGLGNVYTQEKH